MYPSTIAAISEAKKEVARRGWSISQPNGRSPGTFVATKGAKTRNIRVFGQEKKRGQFLKPGDAQAADIIIIHVRDGSGTWVLSRTEALRLIAVYQAQYLKKHGRPVKQDKEGWDASQFPRQTGWSPLSTLL